MTGIAAIQLWEKLNRKLETTLGEVEIISARSREVLVHSISLAFAIHFMFVALFFAIEAWSLVQLNMLSLLAFGVCMYLAHYRKSTLLVLLLFSLQLLLHVAVMLSLLGWDSGFHFYLLVFIPFIFSDENASLVFRVAAAVVLCTIYLVLNFLTESVVPPLEITETTMRAIRFGNIVGVFVAFSFLATMHRQHVEGVEKGLKQMVNTDSLTGLKNRRYVLELLENELNRHERSGKSMSIAVIDIDNFKSINDTFGHDVGDMVLVDVADTLRKSLRKQDYISRWGGEEFLVLYPETDASGVETISNLIRQNISNIRIPTLGFGDDDLRLTVSIGCTEIEKKEGFDLAFIRADRALFTAKKTGKNRVVSG